MRQRPLNVLLVEHDPQEFPELTANIVRAGDPPLLVERVGELAEGLERLSRGGIDVVLLDLNLPDSRGAVTFERAHAFAPHVPIVVLTDSAEDQMALGTVQGGAQDHLVRHQATPSLVVRALRYAVERHRLISALKSLSLIDELTDLYNRRGFVDLGEQYLKLARRKDREVTLVLLDLNHFKSINHRFGHHVGDRALVEVSDILRATFRCSDLMARLEADCFAVLAFEASDEAAEVLVRRVRERMEESNREGRQPYRLSATISVARHREEGPSHLHELLTQAASTLFEMKQRGSVGTP